MRSFLQVVHESREQLTAADRRLVSTLLARPTEAAFRSVVEVARRVGVHQASAVRLAKKPGFEGYPELRVSFQNEILNTSESAQCIARRLEGMHGGGALSALIESDMAALAHIPEHLSQASIDRAARVLLGARRIFLFASGNATILSDMVDRRLRRAGYATMLATQQGCELAERLVGLDAKDALLAFRISPGAGRAAHRVAPGGAVRRRVDSGLRHAWPHDGAAA